MSDITIPYAHFENLNKNVLRLGAEVRELTEKLKKAERRAESLREAGDEVWYCYRHREPLNDAINDWIEARDGLKD